MKGKTLCLEGFIRAWDVKALEAAMTPGRSGTATILSPSMGRWVHVPPAAYLEWESFHYEDLCQKHDVYQGCLTNQTSHGFLVCS